MNVLNFSHNWNNKLDCKAFTTLRISNKFELEETIQIKLKGKPIEGVFQCKDKRIFKLDDINEFIARLDTGYSASECKEILKKMYKNKNIDWSKQDIFFYLIVKL